MTDHSFAEYITTRRRDLDLSLGDVASTLEVSPISVSNWSNGYSVPDRETIIKLAQLLQSDPAELSRIAEAARVEIDPEAEPQPLESHSSERPNLEPVEEQPESDEDAVADTSNPPEAAGSGDAVEVPDSSDELAGRKVQLAPSEAVVPLEEVTAEEWVTTELEPAGAGQATSTATKTVQPPPLPAEDEDFFAFEEPFVADGQDPGAPEVAAFAPTYVEDTQLLWRYRIRWAITAVVLVIMVFVLFWSVGNMWDTLKSGIDSVLPD